ncbi:right-handed parallel beta-helix repeat-containing protein, partial [uncultured Paraglaciecola sp.]|uniref:right-handed parallel beta-helix repeat-containing protein n=1 Tax=uncultured Paraglaciecola sp. TaxID=1765024 RepID=UPI002597E294
IRYARISGATYCIQSNSAVDDINNNHLSGCRYGVYTNSGSPRITNNLIAENSEAGIYVGNSNPTIKYNTLDLNGDYGVYIHSGYDNSNQVLENNIITRNNVGLYNGDDTTRGYNNIWGNGTDYSSIAAAETDISSDPQYLDPYA